MNNDMIDKLNELIISNITNIKKQNKIYDKINKYNGKISILKKIPLIQQIGLVVKFQVKLLKLMMDIEQFMKEINVLSNIKT